MLQCRNGDSSRNFDQEFAIIWRASTFDSQGFFGGSATKCSESHSKPGTGSGSQSCNCNFPQGIPLILLLSWLKPRNFVFESGLDNSIDSRKRPLLLNQTGGEWKDEIKKRHNSLTDRQNISVRLAAGLGVSVPWLIDIFQKFPLEYIFLLPILVLSERNRMPLLNTSIGGIIDKRTKCCVWISPALFPVVYRHLKPGVNVEIPVNKLAQMSCRHI